MKFASEKVSSLLGHTEVVVSEQAEEVPGPAPGGFRMVSSRAGFHFEGKSSTITSTDELDQFAKAVGAAWTAHLSLKPKITRTISGH